MQIVKTGDVKAPKTIEMMVYGFPGVGKSTFAASFPKPLYLDFENGTKYFGMNGIDVDVLQMSSWFTDAEKTEFGAMLKNYETLVIDPVGEMLECISSSPIAIAGGKYRQSNGDLSIAGWGRLKTIARDFVTWARRQGVNVVVVGHAREEKDEESGATMIRPKVPGSFKEDINQLVEIIGYLHITSFPEKGEDGLVIKNEDGTVKMVEKRIITTRPTAKYFAKDRTGALDMHVKPDYKYIRALIDKKSDDVVSAKEAEAEAQSDEKPKAATKKAVADPVEKKDGEGNPFNKK
jgi:hypothetical protein